MAKPLLQYYLHQLGTCESWPEKTAIVLIVDSAGRLVRWNRAAEALIGYSETEMVGNVLWDTLIFKEDIEPVKRQLKWIMSGCSPVFLEYRWRLRDGTARWMACSNFERRTSPDGMECLAFTATDITAARLTRDWRNSVCAEFARARETERHEISRFIHDTIAQNLVALTFHIEQWRRGPGTAGAGAALDLVDRCCRDVRLLGYMLAPADLGDGGLLEAMERHGRTLREAGAIDIDFRAETDQELLSPEARSVLFSAVQEFTAKAITNGANKQLGIVLSSEGPSVLLEMKGSFDSQGEAGRDLGCPAIRERVGALGGRLDMTPGSVRIALPTALTAAA